MKVSVVILTYNSEKTIGATLATAAQVSDDIHIVDSFSRDSTLEIARSFDAHVAEHAFEHYGLQRNWAIDNLTLKYDWQLHLDADERLSEMLVRKIRELHAGGEADAGPVGYYVPRLVHFMGSPIRHGGMYPIWHLRLFRRGCGRCESRRYDQHFFVNGVSGRIDAPMIDDIQMDLTEWTTRHLRWADGEVGELLDPSARAAVPDRPGGDPVRHKRQLRDTYGRLPRFSRAFALFFYRYVLRGGFRDGKPGLIFFVLQTFWFRFMIDAKLYERLLNAPRDAG